MDVHSPEFLATLSLAFDEFGKSKKKKKAPCRVRPREMPKSRPDSCGRALCFLMLCFIAFQADGMYRAIPWYGFDPGATLAVQLMFGAVVLFVLVLYACASLIDPGRPQAHAAGAGDSVRWCNFCMAPKPERCHHCTSGCPLYELYLLAVWTSSPTLPQKSNTGCQILTFNHSQKGNLFSTNQQKSNFMRVNGSRTKVQDVAAACCGWIITACSRIPASVCVISRVSSCSWP